MSIITRAGTAALTREEVRQAPANRHPQTGRFIPKTSAPVKTSGSKPKGKVVISGGSK